MQAELERKTVSLKSWNSLDLTLEIPQISYLKPPHPAHVSRVIHRKTEIISLLGINRLVFEWERIVFIDLYDINVQIYFRLNPVFKAV
jgi:hypothetical protein